MLFPHVPARVAATTGLAVFSIATLSGCQPYGCQPGFSTPAEAKRDLAEFNRVLARNPAFRGLKATAVHGHEVDVVDTNVGQDFTFVPNHGRGISDKLRDAWRTTFVRLHPHALNAKIVDIDVKDPEGRPVISISSGECVTL